MMTFRLHREVSVGMLLILCYARPGLTEDYFDPAALELSSSAQERADLRYFSEQGGQMPGTWAVTIELNGHEEGTETLTFVAVNGDLQPELSVDLLAKLGVNVGVVPAFSRLHKGETFTRIGDFIPAAKVKYDFSQQRLALSIPQAAMKNRSRGYVPSSQWDDGITAGFIDYNLTGATAHRQSGDGTSAYLSLRNGINIGPWRLRNTSSLNYSETGGSRWQSQSSWLSRDLRGLKSQLRVGDAWTPGEIFDSVGFRGLQVATSESMLPDSQRGYAPTVRGVAHSFARVSVSQHGYVIYETWVAAGPFVINDLFPGAQSGDLEVTITESDGTKRTFTQPYSAIPFMLREGRFKYSVSVGRYHSGESDVHNPNFVETTFFYGLPGQMTLYGGGRGADNYQAIALGLGRSFGEFGSIGIDDTLAKSRLPDGDKALGQAWRLQYQKDFTSTGTAFSLASYRYATRNFYEFGELNQADDSQLRRNNRRSRSQLTMTQSLGDMGSLSVSAWMQDYWHTAGEDKTIHLGWYTSWRGVTVGLGYYYTDSAVTRDPERTVSFNVNIPLGKWLPDSSVSYFFNQSNRGIATQQVSLNGTALADRSLSYNLQQGLSGGGQQQSTSLGVQYSGGYGNASVGYDQSGGTRNISLGLSGGVLATRYGVTFSQPLSDTVALLRVPGAKNVSPEGFSSIHTDSRGYAVIPSVSAYRKNTLTLNTETLSENADVEQSGGIVIPTSGAVVLADYKTHIGYRVLFSLRYKGAPLPFGATAGVIENPGSEGMVADGGEAYLSGVPERGTLRVRWNKNGMKIVCQAPFTLSAAHTAPGIATLSLDCQ
jgi:outer membrane usher protein